MSSEPDIVFPGREWAVATPESQGLDSRRFQKAMDYVHRICLGDRNRQCLVVRHGRLLWQGSDVDQVHVVWSITKSFVSAVLGLLLEDGKCALETRAADYVPSLRRHYPEVTFRQLLTFTSGYQCRPKFALEPIAPAFPLGTKFMYSDEYDQLANALAQIAGEPLADFFKRRIADPIGMDPAHWRWGDWGLVGGILLNGGAGMYESGIHISARELARFGHLFLTGGLWNGRPLLSRRWVEEATRPQVSAGIPLAEPEPWYKKVPGAYGYGWWVNGFICTGRRRFPAAPGGLFSCQGNRNNTCYVIPEWNMVIVRLGMDGRIRNDLWDHFFTLMREAIVDLPRPEWPPPSPPRGVLGSLREFVGGKR
jgi:CubicO group peptidase (beta-lactamase class C family)